MSDSDSARASNKKRARHTSPKEARASNKKRARHTSPKESGAMPEKKELQVLLLGKTGSGKSSLGNTLLGEKKFEVSSRLISATERCSWGQVKRREWTVKVTDTPGMWDTPAGQTRDLKLEIVKSIAVVAPGPHVVLMLMRCDTPLTQGEMFAYKTLIRIFGQGICKHMILVFVGVDAFEGDTLEQRQNAAKQFVDSPDCPEDLRQILVDVAGRFYFVDNTASTELKEKQVNELLVMMQELMAQNEGSYFTNIILEKADDLIYKETTTALSRDEILQSMSEDHGQPAVSYRILGHLKELWLDFVREGCRGLGRGAVEAAVEQCSIM